jgi:hypothetical protein
VDGGVSRVKIIVGFAGIDQSDELVDGLKQQLAVALSEYARYTAAQVVSYNPSRGGRSERDDLEEVLLDMDLVGGSAIAVQRVHETGEIGCEGQKVELLLFGRKRVELLDVQVVSVDAVGVWRIRIRHAGGRREELLE